jgi:lipoyl(octanoyl) transferase
VLPWRVLDLGTRPFRDVWTQQLALVEARQRGDGEDTLIVVEHPHVFTLGRSRAARDNVLAPGDVEVVEIERGGDATYHGPGQLVCYPIVALRDDSERDLHRFLRRLEDAVIATCARVDVLGDREPGKTGVWTTSAAGTRKKLCSMGIACRRWVTFHGLALNVTTDLGYFARINPCGFEASVMSSLAAERATESVAEAISVPRVREMLAEELGLALGRAAGAA